MKLNLNWPGVIVAAIAVYLFGWFWYGVAFEAQWEALTAVTAESDDWGAMLWGVPATLVTMIGLGWLIGRDGSWAAGLKTGLMAGVFFAVTTSSFAYIYEGANPGLIPIDWGHLLIAFGLGGAVIGGLKAGKAG